MKTVRMLLLVVFSLCIKIPTNAQKFPGKIYQYSVPLNSVQYRNLLTPKDILNGESAGPILTTTTKVMQTMLNRSVIQTRLVCYTNPISLFGKIMSHTVNAGLFGNLSLINN